MRHTSGEHQSISRYEISANGLSEQLCSHRAEYAENDVMPKPRAIQAKVKTPMPISIDRGRLMHLAKTPPRVAGPGK